MNMGQALSEQAEKFARMDRARETECRAFNASVNEHCRLQAGHDGWHLGWMYHWPTAVSGVAAEQEPV